jgi:cysteinyl-tRNA synthetase
MSNLTLYDSLTGELRPFEPIHAPNVGMYVCGPTVYSDVHLGNTRTFLSFDLLFRYLKHLGYKVRYVRNITDAGHLESDSDVGEDKIAKKARLEQLEPMEIVQRYTVGFRAVMQAYNALPPSIEPTATGHIVEQIEMIKKLILDGYAYEANGSVYFSIGTYLEKYPYGELSGRSIEDLESGTRDLDGQQDKRHPLDFALWKKASPEHIMRWPSPWSDGFPGWHLECSAMSTKYLGEEFDIHGGGMDLKFPHHECEIAQNKGATGHGGARYWLHANMLTLNGKRMAKSTGNTLDPRDLLTGESPHLSKAYTPGAVRFFIHQAHYRSVLDFSDSALQAAEKGYYRLLASMEALAQRPAQGPDRGTWNVAEWNAQCSEAMNQDLNSPVLIAHLFDASKAIAADQKDPNILGLAGAAELLNAMNTWMFDVLGLAPEHQSGSGKYQKALDAAMSVVLDVRRKARESKDWSTSDALRDALAQGGIVVQDGPEGSSFRVE